MRPRTKFMIGGVLVLGTSGWLMASSIKQTGEYYLTPTEMASRLKADPTFKGADVRIGARVVPGSIKRDPGGREYSFRVVDTTTGEVSFTRTEEARSTGGGINVGVYRGGFGGRLEKEQNTPTGKAIRAVIMEISEYLACAMVDQDGCMDDYEAKESSRRAKTKKAIKLD